MLSCLLNEDWNKYYSWSNYQIDLQLLRKRLSQLPSLGYSQQIVNCLKKCLQPDESDRFSLRQLISQV